MACGNRGTRFSALQEELLGRAKATGARQNVLASIAYSTCYEDLLAVHELLRDGVFREFLASSLEEHNGQRPIRQECTDDE